MSDSENYYIPLTKDNLVMVSQMVLDDSVYGPNFDKIDDFIKNHRDNTDMDVILSKILLIDFTNSTNLHKHVQDTTIYDLADRIRKIENIDERIMVGDTSVVDLIARNHDKTINTQKSILFSFATKYCCYHNRAYNNDHYSIYDSLVANILPHYLEVCQCYPIKFKQEVSEIFVTAENIKKYITNRVQKNHKISTYYDEKMHYDKFHTIIQSLIDKMKPNFDDKVDKIRRKLDHFLWVSAKLLNKQKEKQKESPKQEPLFYIPKTQDDLKNIIETLVFNRKD